MGFLQDVGNFLDKVAEQRKQSEQEIRQRAEMLKRFEMNDLMEMCKAYDLPGPKVRYMPTLADSPLQGSLFGSNQNSQGSFSRGSPVRLTREDWIDYCAHHFELETIKRFAERRNIDIS
jgi:hypothetical protein